MTRCVCLLQNSWSGIFAGDFWPRPSWLCALHRSPTGRGLARIFPPPAEGVWFDNTTPAVAPDPDGVCLPDPDHILAVLGARRPDFVLACGKQAEEAVTPLWEGRLIVMPHPAWRLMSNSLLDHVAAVVRSDDFQRIKVTSTASRTITTAELTYGRQVGGEEEVGRGKDRAGGKGGVCPERG